MNWKKLNDIEQFITIDMQSHLFPVVIFKHSTRCSISETALNRLERDWKEEDMTDIHSYYLDLIAYRTLSNAIADHYGIQHESPQVLIIKKGECVYHASHMEINYNELKSQALK